MSLITTSSTLKTMWVNALRSGKYEQEPEKLRRAGSNAYCCLGVLCNVVDPGGWLEDENQNASDKELWLDRHDPQVIVHIGESVASGNDAEYARTANSDDNYPPKRVMDRSLADQFAKLNDDYHFSFEQIARVAEASDLTHDEAKLDQATIDGILVEINDAAACDCGDPECSVAE